jgi:hypothetical protein
MAGIALFILFIFMARSWQRPDFWIWFGKGVQLVALLYAFDLLPAVDKPLLIPAFAFLFAPMPFIKGLVVPLGLPRAAYWVGRCCGPVALMKDAGAGAALYGALALARRPGSPQSIAWLAQRASDAPTVKGPGLVAAGLLAALRGERHRARSLFILADSMPRNFISDGVKVIARDWLVADAARNGDWPEVIRRGRRGRDSLRWSYALARLGERFTGDPKGRHGLLLWLCWIEAPRRLATLPLLRRALARPPLRPPFAEPRGGGELPDALAALAWAIESRFMQDAGSLARALAAVETALERSSTQGQIEQRLRALGAGHDPAATIAGFRQRVLDLVDPLIEEQPRLAGAQDRSPLLNEAVARVRSRLFREVEAQCRDCSERERRRTSLSALTEWETWAVMREAAERLLELAPDSEHALFATMYVRMCNFAVYQHNICKRVALAHHIFAWLRRHSDSDPSACELLSKNMRASQG